VHDVVVAAKFHLAKRGRVEAPAARVVPRRWRQRCDRRLLVHEGASRRRDQGFGRRRPGLGQQLGAMAVDECSVRIACEERRIARARSRRRD
jgi:hypothetical protein